MTTIKSVAGISTLEVTDTGDGNHAIVFRRPANTAMYGQFPSADLRAALGVDEMGCGCDEADDNLTEALARAEAAEAKAELWRNSYLEADDNKVVAEAKAASHVAQIHALEEKLAAVKLQSVEMRCCATESGSAEANFAWNQAAGMIEAALADSKPFVLPTEVPARIEAIRAGELIELVLWSNGERAIWRDIYGLGDGGYDDYTPEQVMAKLTGHRILGADK